MNQKLLDYYNINKIEEDKVIKIDNNWIMVYEEFNPNNEIIPYQHNLYCQDMKNSDPNCDQSRGQSMYYNYYYYYFEPGYHAYILKFYLNNEILWYDHEHYCIGESVYLRVKDKLFVYGDNSKGQLGTHMYEHYIYYPVEFPLIGPLTDIKVYGKSIYVKINKTWYAMGENSKGQLGIGKNIKCTNCLTKMIIDEEIIDWIFLKKTIIVKTKSGYYAFGRNRSGYLGIGTYKKYIYTPTKILFDKSIEKFVMINNLLMFITPKKRLYICGNTRIFSEFKNKVNIPTLYKDEKVLWWDFGIESEYAIIVTNKKIYQYNINIDIEKIKQCVFDEKLI